jgi:DNA-binding NtrC family response regulator
MAADNAPADNAPTDNAPTVLIVEDEPVVRLALQATLEDHGFATLEAANAREALDAIAKMGRSIDLVFTDIRMPGEMDGMKLAQWVHRQMPHIPVIVASGYSANAQEAMAAGENFCQKPYRLEDVVARIRATIESFKSATRQ